MGETKAKTMDAVSHRETAALVRAMKAAPPPRRSMPVAAALDAVQVMKQAGWVKTAGVAAAYVGKIREADRGMQARQGDSRLPQRTARREDFERL